MEHKMRRTPAYTHERISQIVNGVDTVRKSQRGNEEVLEEIRFCVAEKFREMRWR